LLAVCGPLIDAGHQVQLLDAEFDPMKCGISFSATNDKTTEGS